MNTIATVLGLYETALCELQDQVAALAKVLMSNWASTSGRINFGLGYGQVQVWGENTQNSKVKKVKMWIKSPEGTDPLGPDGPITDNPRSLTEFVRKVRDYHDSGDFAWFIYLHDIYPAEDAATKFLRLAEVATQVGSDLARKLACGSMDLPKPLYRELVGVTGPRLYLSQAKKVLLWGSAYGPKSTRDYRDFIRLLRLTEAGVEAGALPKVDILL